MDQLIFFDKKLLLLINGMHCQYWDCFFRIYTGTLVWLPLFVALAWMFFRRQNVQGIVSIFFVAMVVLVCDQVSSSICKPLFERLRPTHDDVLQYLVHTVGGYRGGSYGFVSSHAANAFGIVTFVTLVVRNRALGMALTAWALINCYSRAYLGVHYVGDLVAGMLLGIVVGAVAYQLYLRSIMRFIVIPRHNKRTLKSGLARSFATSPAAVAVIFWTLTVTIAICTKMIYRFAEL